ncbi:DJ-1/PfpI family protein [Duganella radicis]|uniref:DJ-1/PfpI family protein n=1 Tax=Duganella radicis TaxID=551988 RepID=A0A6L6PR94_9BURK|nr:DJ-1/PfpI family protein [Duganella radicis]MTV40745.1 DJ-1/PfpI family protein [Duganella radicis]
MTRSIGIYVYDDVGILDVAGPYEVFTCATRVSAMATPEAPPFRIRTVGRTPALLRARAGLTVFPEADFGGAGIDVLIVPGGVVDAELARPDVMAWIAGVARDCELVAAIGTGAFLLTQAGLLDGRPVAARQPPAGPAAAFPELRIAGKRRLPSHGAIVAAGGVTAGIDVSLHLVARLAGRELARATARHMDYDWTD